MATKKSYSITTLPYKEGTRTVKKLPHHGDTPSPTPLAKKATASRSSGGKMMRTATPRKKATRKQSAGGSAGRINRKELY